MSEAEQETRTGDSEVNKAKIDFTHSIERIEKRARRSRFRVMTLSLILGAAILGIVTFLLGSLAYQSSVVLRTEPSFALAEAYRSERSLLDPLERHILALMAEISGPADNEEVFVPPDADTLVNLNSQLDGAIERLERVKEIVGPTTQVSNDGASLVPILTTGIFSFGVIGIIVLIINICMSFIRYHSQLAELYDSQAEALKASGGSAELAYRFADRFSPTVVVMGKIPASLYEKALDLAKEAVSRNTKGPG